VQQALSDDAGRTELRCLKCDVVDPLKTKPAKWAESSLAQPRALSEVTLEDEFYKERARHIRELADKADPFIRKRLLDLAGNYDSMVRRSPHATATARLNLPNVSAKE
jgi:hypothetical protein